jgi:two-component system, OmpR family, response regulator RegX3
MTIAAPSLRIALLEDDPAYGELLRAWLASANHVCHWETRAQPFMRLLTRETFDVVMLDWQVPDGSGEDVLAWLRKTEQHQVPVLFVTSRDSEADVARILERGADDYLTKPIRRLELLARVRALARRSQGATAAKDVIDIGNLRIDPIGETVQRDGAQVDLAPKEFSILALLARNAGRLLSRGQIYELVWGRVAPDSLRTVDTHVSQIRSKLGLTPANGWKLTSVYQHGYRLEFIGMGASEAGAPTAEGDDSTG